MQPNYKNRWDNYSSFFFSFVLCDFVDSKLQTSSAAWYMAASHKTKVVAKNISRIALMAEETTKYIAQG